MKAKKYLIERGDGEGSDYTTDYVENLMTEFAEQQNKELIDKLTQCETANTDFQSENRNLIAMSQNLDGKNKNQRRSLKSLIQENKELIEAGRKITNHIFRNVNTLTDRNLLKLCSAFDLRAPKK